MSYIYLGSTFNPDSLTFKDVLLAYSKGYFPMGDDDGIISWYDHEPRSIIPLNNDGLRISRSLKQIIKSNKYEIKIDNDFYSVIHSCADSHGDTWITGEIISLYVELFNKGFAHSVEAYLNGKLAGGLYGVALKSAFFGESMFFTQPNASKVCVAFLYNLLLRNNFNLFDIQMTTPLFKSFGAEEIAAEEYRKMLKTALKKDSAFVP
ncbi:MAG: leucyl/phenylalanyl-tRNA--protein transferase [Ignavibacteria bacterium]|nr:leucyl/phenylalanyl-tRNA--protein transferase [Ignavibacteria bacterium]